MFIGMTFTEPQTLSANGDIQAMYNAFYADYLPLNLSYQSEADIDTRFVMGDTSVLYSIYGNVPNMWRRNFSFNITRPIVDMVAGTESEHRTSIIVTPVHDSDQQTADQFTKIFFWLNQRENYLQTASDAFKTGSCTTGMSLIHVYLDYRNDPISGDIKFEHVPYNAFLIDPFFRKLDLSDCRGISKRSYVTAQELMSLMPDTEGMINNVGAMSGNMNAPYQYMPENFAASNRQLLSYDEFYYRAFRNAIMLTDTETGEVMEWTGKDDDTLRQYLAEFPTIRSAIQSIPTVRLAIFVQGKVVWDGPQPTGLDIYPFAVCVGHFNPQSNDFPFRIQGIVRNLRDSQFLFNRFMAIQMDTVESQPNTGWVMKEDTLVNPEDAFSKAGQGLTMVIKQNAQITDLQKMQPAHIDPTISALAEKLGNLPYQIAGVSRENLGQSVDDLAGITEMLRQRAGLVVLRGLFDNFEIAKINLGKIMMRMIQINFAPGKISKILGEKPSAQFYTKLFSEYNCAIEQGYNTTTQKQLAFAQALHLKFKAGLPIPDSYLLQKSTLPDKSDLIKDIEGQQQQQQEIQQRQAQLQLAELEANIKLANARATADQGLGIERISRVRENQALAEERKAQAVKEDQEAVLAMAKTLKELQSIDLSHLKELISMAQMLKVEKNMADVQTSTEMTGAANQEPNINTTQMG